MATAFNTNAGIHQLSSGCYPPSDSDDEDSFVVLSTSLGPDVHTDKVHLNTEPLSTKAIEDSLQTIAASMQCITMDDAREQLTVDSATVSYQSADISADEIQRKVDNLIAENLKLKDTLAQNNMAMKKQVESITQWQEEVQRVQESHKEKFTDMKRYLAILKAENEKLTEIVKNTQTHTLEEKKSKEVSLKQNDNILQFELEAAHKTIKELQKALDILCFEKEDLGKKMVLKDRQINDLIAEGKQLTNDISLLRDIDTSHKNSFAIDMQTLKDEIVELRDTNNNLTDQISRLQNQNETLKTNFKDRDDKLEQATRSLFALEQDLVQTKQQLMASQMHITELKESNTKKLTEKNEEIIGLQDELRVAKLNCDENTALRAQLDLYKNDFEMERTQRKELLEEKNRIADEFQQLQRRNNQLHEEIDQMRAGFVPVSREETPTAPKDSPPFHRHICPICSAKFGSVLLLEDHIEYCLINNANT